MSDEGVLEREAEKGVGVASEETQAGPGLKAFAYSREFWIILAFGIPLGIALAFGSLAFLGVTDGGVDLWFDEAGSGWFDGELWWLAVTVGAGVAVGLLRIAFKMPPNPNSLVSELEEEHVEPASVPGTVAVSAVSLIGGASVGPEAALASMGGGLGTWVSERRGLNEEETKSITLVGMAGAFGGLLSSPWLAVLMVLELAKPPGPRFGRVIVAGGIAAAISFGIFFAIAGTVFLGVYPQPEYDFKDWHLLAAVPLGVVAAGLALVLWITVGMMKRITKPLERLTVLRPALGGLAFGLVGVALPLTLFTGSVELSTVVEDGAVLGAGLLIAVILGKILAFAFSISTGFIGGPLFPALFIGGTAGIVINILIPEIPQGYAFATMMAAMSAAILPAPFTMVLLAALLTGVGALNTGPIAVAVLVSYLVFSGLDAVTKIAARGQAPSSA